MLGLQWVMECADNVSCLHKQGARRCVTKFGDKQVGKPIVMFGQNNLFVRTFYGPTPCKKQLIQNNINTFRPLDLVIATGMWRDFQQAYQKPTLPWYLRLHWIFSVTTLQLLFMVKQQHDTLTLKKWNRNQPPTPSRHNRWGLTWRTLTHFWPFRHTT